ncbi:MAG: hypothetical protein MJ154_02925 [Candidatus Saccharibacteria bacterium]|nr:hypothetical protein [Candidatus Saccharibacteria bacterium]
MKKLLLGAFAALALAASAASSDSFALTGTTLSKDAPVKSIPLVHTLKGVSGRVDVKYTYDFIPSEDNPASVGGSNLKNMSGYSGLVLSKVGKIVSDCSLALQNLYFYKVGNYTFTISEKESSDELNFPHDSENKYDIYFQVTNKLDENNEPTGELNVELLDQMYSYKTESKVPLRANFESVANYTYITLQNKVSGAGADSEKYFKYKITFENLADDAELTIAGQDPTVEYNGETITTVYSQRNSDGPVYVYLKHGQTATIGRYESDKVLAHELPQNVSYTIEKMDNDDDYLVTLDNSEATAVTKTVAGINADEFTTNNTTIAGNNRDATVNTGVFVESWPFMIVVAFGLGGFVIFRRLSRVN